MKGLSHHQVTIRTLVCYEIRSLVAWQYTVELFSLYHTKREHRFPFFFFFFSKVFLS